MKKVVSLILAVAMLLSLSTFVAASGGHGPGQRHHAREHINSAVCIYHENCPQDGTCIYRGDCIYHENCPQDGTCIYQKEGRNAQDRYQKSVRHLHNMHRHYGWQR